MTLEQKIQEYFDPVLTCLLSDPLMILSRNLTWDIGDNLEKNIQSSNKNCSDFHVLCMSPIISSFNQKLDNFYSINLSPSYRIKHPSLLAGPLEWIQCSHSVFKFLLWEREREIRGVMDIVAGIGHGDTSSNPGRNWLHFT